MKTLKELFETKELITVKGCFISLGYKRQVETLRTIEECKEFLFKSLSKEEKCIEFIFEKTTITFFK